MTYASIKSFCENYVTKNADMFVPKLIYNVIICVVVLHSIHSKYISIHGLWEPNHMHTCYFTQLPRAYRSSELLVAASHEEIPLGDSKLGVGRSLVQLSFPFLFWTHPPF